MLIDFYKILSLESVIFTLLQTHSPVLFCYKSHCQKAHTAIICIYDFGESSGFLSHPWVHSLIRY